MTNILVIDDCHEITTMLETILSSDTCYVQTAHSGRSGMQVLRTYPFDVVITDIVMPESDGFEVIMEINRMQPRPRVIAMTGGTVHLSREYLSGVAVAMKVQQVLYKPFTIDELLGSVFPHEDAALADEFVRYNSLSGNKNI
jgi:DNA-binding NtrC family response regulator